MLKNSRYISSLCLAVFLSATVATAKNAKGESSGGVTESIAPHILHTSEFRWSEHNKLTWADFRGRINAETRESAAATHCSIGFTVTLVNGGEPEIKVFNTFYTTHSWVRSDAMLPEVLDHEQGHFDLCELYTRELRLRMSRIGRDTKDVKAALTGIYNKLKAEYEGLQQQYEQETIHGTNTTAQKKWQDMISKKLAAD